MKKFIIPFALLALIGVSAPVTTSPAEAQGFSVRIGDGNRGYGRHHYRGRHHGWHRGRQHGWYNGHRRHHGFYGNNRGRVVIIQRGYGYSNW